MQLAMIASLLLYALASTVVTSATPPLGQGAPTRSTIRVDPARARPGDAFLVTVGPAPAPPEGSAGGRPLSFFRVRGGYAAVGALPVETAPGPLPILVVRSEREALEATLDVAPAGFPERSLQVARRFVEQPDPALQARIDDDRAAFAQAFAQPRSAPLFSTGFGWPRRDRVTAGFGEQRTLNGVKPSQHYGVDLAGRIGAPVLAANAGQVVLVRDCWASGRTVIVWHGAGLYTTYFHLSRALVRRGQRVAKGQRIGLVGSSGRVSGPHLHWSVRVGDLYVDPRSVLRLPLGDAG